MQNEHYCTFLRLFYCSGCVQTNGPCNSTQHNAALIAATPDLVRIQPRTESQQRETDRRRQQTDTKYNSTTYNSDRRNAIRVMHPQQMVTAHSPFGSTQQGGEGRKIFCLRVITLSPLASSLEKAWRRRCMINICNFYPAILMGMCKHTLHWTIKLHDEFHSCAAAFAGTTTKKEWKQTPQGQERHLHFAYC